MCDPSPAPPPAPACPAVSLSSSITVVEGAVREQVAAVSPTGIVDLSDMEFTQLQEFLCSHISNGDVETRTSRPIFLSGNAPHYQSHSSEGHNLCPAICQSAPTTHNNSLVPANQTLGAVDFQELSVLILSDCSLPPPPGGQMLDDYPNNASGDSSGAGLLWLSPASDVIGLEKENENVGHISGPRTKSTVRVRLEDRFNSSPADVPRRTEMRENGVTANNLVTIVPHPSQLIETQQPRKHNPLVDSKAFPSSLQLVSSCISLQNMTPSKADSSLTQSKCSLNCRGSCPLLLAAKNQEISRPQDFSLCYKQDLEPTKQFPGPRNKEIFVTTQDMSCKESVNMRGGSHSQTDVDMERRVLSDIRNVCQGASRPDHTAAQVSDTKQASLSQRKERHNLMERNRRRKIRVCCDQLNSLVPCCTVETDKATTLQWTTSFLKYLQDTHGDTLKKEFLAVICGKTVKRLKVVKPEGARAVAAGSGSLQDDE